MQNLCALLLVTFGFVAGAEAADRYAAMLQDGQRVSANDVANWQDPAQTPTLAGKNLFDAVNPFRWIVDTTRPLPQPPAAYVEFFGGDRIPGEVTASRSGAELPIDQAPPHLVVQSEAELAPFDSGGRDVVRVSTEWVQRVVWEATPGREYRPGTAFLRDGRALPFRSVRWGESSATLLTEQGVTTLSFSDLAELHASRRNPWEAWLDQLALLVPSGTGRLISEETSQGARFTTSLERFRPQVRGDRNKTESWLHVMQPAWSLDPLWVRFNTIVRWRFFAPHQVPLSMATPLAVKQESVFATGSRWQVDQNVHGQPLRANGLDFGWGFGVQARNELTFEVPAGAKSFRTFLALDESAGDGGCARGVVFLETDARRPIYQSEIVIGTKKVLDSGVLSLPTSPAAKLVLVADPVIHGRPTGADPFDIRDSFDWLLPELEFDPQYVQQEVARRAFAHIAAFAGWTVSPADIAKCKIINHWDEAHPRDARYRVLLTADAPFVMMSRKMKIAGDQKWLGVSVTRPPTKTTPVRVQVRVDGAALGEFEVPAHASPTPPDPMLLPIADHQEKTVTVEVVQIPEKADGAVDWRAVAPVDRWPGLLRVFEDDPEFARALTDGTGEIEVVNENPHRGTGALRVTPTDRGNVKLPNLSVPIREYPEFGEYRYVRFAWRMDDSSQIYLSMGHNGEFGGDGIRRRERSRPGKIKAFPGSRRGVTVDDRGMQVGYRYDAGKGPPPPGGAIRLGGPDPKWVEITRDLYADFGNFTLTGLQFGCVEGKAGWFDHIYLGRTVQDLDAIRDLFPQASPPAADPNVAMQATDRAKFGPIVSRVAPLFSTTDSNDGVMLLKEKSGRKNVLRTMPPKNETPCILRTALAVPGGKSTTLELAAGHDPKTEWQLVVTANGQTIHDGVVNESTAKEGWLDLTVDLTRFAGQNIVLTVENRPKGGRQPGYWGRVAVNMK